MTPQVHITDRISRGVISSLRPPCAQSVTVKRGYSLYPRHLGMVLVLPSTNEPITAPASGVIVSITSKTNVNWEHSAGVLDIHKTFEVKIDHGGNVYTAIQGFQTVSPVVGQLVTRGDILGYGRTEEFFFQLFYLNSPLDPATYTEFLRGFDGGKVTGKARKLRGGPDFITRAVSNTVSYIMGGIRYFVDKFCTKPDLLVNIDFNGLGAKSGPAVAGIDSSDYWNVYTPVTFDTSDSYICYAVLNPPTELISGVEDAGTMSVSWYDGTLFTLIFPTEATDSGTIAHTWLYGSTDTVPEIESATMDATWSIGTLSDAVLSYNGTDQGTMFVSWESGSLRDTTIAFSGTEYGTIAWSWASGTLTESLFTQSGTDAGTMSVSWSLGTLYTMAYPAPDQIESGTTAWSWWSGTIVET